MKKFQIFLNTDFKIGYLSVSERRPFCTRTEKVKFFVTYRVDSWVDWWVGVKAVEGVLTAGKKIEHLE